jgi:hypothetical protein
MGTKVAIIRILGRFYKLGAGLFSLGRSMRVGAQFSMVNPSLRVTCQWATWFFAI